MTSSRADGVPIAHASVAAHYVMAASLGLRPAAGGGAALPAAALDAAGQLAFEDAAGHLRRALAALPLADHPAADVRLDLLLSLGVALDHAGDATAAREVLVEAADLARQLGDTGLRPGRHRHPPVGCAERPVRHHNVRLLEEASRSLADQSSPLRASAGQLGRELHHTWDPGRRRAREVAVEAVDVARSLDDPSSAYLLALHDTSWSVGSAGERLPIVAEMLDLARLAGDRELHAQAQLLKATALLELGDPAAPADSGATAAPPRTSAAPAAAGERCPAEPSSRSWPASSTRPQTSELPPPGSATRSANPTTRACATPSCGSWPASGAAGRTSSASTLGPPGTWPPIRAVLLTARGDRPAAQTVGGATPSNRIAATACAATTAGCP